MSLYEAGGYGDLPKQLSQFGDCIASGADAIVIGAISTVGVAKQVLAAKAKGIPVVAVANSFISPDLSAGVFTDIYPASMDSARRLTTSVKPGETANVVIFPGPAGSGWAEAGKEAFEAVAAKNPQVKLLAVQVWGDRRRDPATVGARCAAGLPIHELHLGDRDHGRGRYRRLGRGEPQRREDLFHI